MTDWMTPLRGAVVAAAPDEESQTIVRAQTNGTGPFVWQKRRGWIQVDYDKTGNTDATSAIQAALAKASASATSGRCVYLPYGICKVGSTSGAADNFTVPWGCTVTGEECGTHAGHMLFVDGGGNGSIPFVGTLLKIGASGNGTGKLFKMRYNSSVRNLGMWYPAQATNATPVAHDYSIFIDTNQHGVTVSNVIPINSYNFLYCNAALPTVEHIRGWPLNRGLALARISDVPRFNDVHFNNVNANTGATLRAWVLANGKAFTVDGVEQFEFNSCFANGYLEGLSFGNLGAGGGSYGQWNGGGFDGCNYCVVVEAAPGLGGLGGLAISNANLIPSALGFGVVFQDTASPSGVEAMPSIGMSNVSMWQAGGIDRAVWIKSGSYGGLTWYGGRCFNQVNARVHNQSTNGYYRTDGLTRRSTEPGDVKDAGCAGDTGVEFVRS